MQAGKDAWNSTKRLALWLALGMTELLGCKAYPIAAFDCSWYSPKAASVKAIKAFGFKDLLPRNCRRIFNRSLLHM